MKKAAYKKGMTLIEILIVMSLIAMVTVGIYNALVNGLKVWDRSQRVLVEEDVVIFFEKITEELRNTYSFSLLELKGNEARFEFPTMIRTTLNQQRANEEEVYVDQLGKVEYSFDPTKDSLYKRRAYYGQAVNFQFGESKKILSSVEDVQFRYLYITDNEELSSLEVLDVIPEAVEISVKFREHNKEKVIKKVIDIPVGGI